MIRYTEIDSVGRVTPIAEDAVYLAVKGVVKPCRQYFYDYDFDCRYLIRKPTQEPCRHCMRLPYKGNFPSQFSQYRPR